VSEFVEECRREWKRLRVPDPVANEMAADLAADLKEAEAEGASAEDVLGSGAFDARLFAASWATGRGVIPPPEQGATPSRRPSRVPIAVAIALVATIVAGLAMVTSRSGSEQRLALASTSGPLRRALVLPVVPARPGLVSPFGLRARLATPVQAFAVHLNGPGVALHALGLILLLIGIVGLIVTMLYWGPWRAALTSAGDPFTGRQLTRKP
jgi:hypothetical protein